MTNINNLKIRSASRFFDDHGIDPEGGTLSKQQKMKMAAAETRFWAKGGVLKEGNNPLYQNDRNPNNLFYEFLIEVDGTGPRTYTQGWSERAAETFDNLITDLNDPEVDLIGPFLLQQVGTGQTAWFLWVPAPDQPMEEQELTFD